MLAECAVVLLVGCTVPSTPSRPPSGSGSGSPSAVPTGPGIDSLVPFSSPTIETLPHPTEAAKVSAADAGAGRSMPWKFLGFAGERDAITVAFVSGDGDCLKHLGFYVRLDGNDVVVEAVSKVEPGRTACAARLMLGRAVLQLPVAVDGPVRLVHPAADPAWTAPGIFD